MNTLKKWFDPSWPVAPRRVPLYYGWIILAVTTFAMIGAVPGSPPGLSPFIEPMLDAFDIQRGHITFAYMTGTILAGLLTWYVGAVFDRFDSRITATLAFFGLGWALMLTGVSDRLAGWLALPGEGRAWGAAGVLALCFFFMRFLGLGVMMTLCRSLLARWFTRHRSLAVSINGVVMSLSFSSAPVLLFFVVDAVGWRHAWMLLGIAFSTVFTLVIYLFVRHSPENSGVPLERDDADEDVAPTDGVAAEPDKDAPIRRGERHFPVFRDLSAREAARTFTFWVFILGLALNGVVGTGLTINLVAVGLEMGLAEQAALALLLPASLFNIVVTLTLGAIGHKTDLRWVLLAMVTGILAETIGIHILDTWTGRVLFALGSGTAWGCFGILINLPWPRYFGSAHLGSINGVVTGITVVTSATGPFLFGQVKDFTGSFLPAVTCCMLFVPLIGIGVFFAGNPQDAYRPSPGSTPG